MGHEAKVGRGPRAFPRALGETVGKRISAGSRPGHRHPGRTFARRKSGDVFIPHRPAAMMASQMNIGRKTARHGETIHDETFGPAFGKNVDGGERLARCGENLATEDRPNAALLRARHKNIGDVGTRVDDRRDLAAHVAQVESRNPGRVVIGEKGHAFGGRDGEAIDIALHSGGQHDARPVIAAEDDGPVDRARRQHGAPGDDLPKSLARHVMWGDRQMIADAFDGAIAIVIESEHRGARHQPDIGQALQLDQTLGDEVQRRRAVDGGFLAEQPPTETKILFGEDDPGAGEASGQRRH